MTRPSSCARLFAGALLAVGTLAGAQTTALIGGDATVPGEIMLKLKSTADLAPLLSRYPVTLVSSFGQRPLYKLKVTGRNTVAKVIRDLALEPGVQIAEPNPIQQGPEARKNQFWAIGTEVEYRAQWAPQAMRLPEAQARTTGQGVRVAVLDTGVDLTHPALAGRLLPGYDYVDNDADPSETGTTANKAYGHGTHVAGLIALAAPGAKIMPLRVLNADGAGDVWALAAALLHAIDPDGNPATDDGAHVINLSLGTLSKAKLFSTLSQLLSCNPPDDINPLHDMTDAGYNDDKSRCLSGNGALMVAAAGNGGSGKEKQYPAAAGEYGLLPIGASNANQQMADFSNFGTWINAAAPGDFITSSVPGGYATWSGTSMAAPLAAGTAALVRSLFPGVTPKDLVRRLERSSSMLCGTKIRQVDAVAALNNTVPPDIVCP